MNVRGVLVLAACFCLSQSFLTEDLETVKRQALEKIDSFERDWENCGKEILEIYENAIAKIEPTGEKKLDLGEFIFNSTFYEIQRIAEVAYDKAGTWSSAVEIRKCITQKRKTWQEHVEDAHSKHFVPKAKAMIKQGKYSGLHQLLAWIVKLVDLSDHIISAVDEAKTDIENATTATRVTDSVARVEVLTKNVIEVERRSFPDGVEIAKLFEKFMDRFLEKWRKEANEIRDKTIWSIKECFPSESTFLS